MSGASFRLDGAVVEFGAVSALAGVDAEISSGEAVALVGPSGAGKTTLLHLLNGTVRPTHGRVTANGHRLDQLGRRALRDLRASLGFVHQDPSLIPNLRVIQNVIAGRFGRMGFLAALRAIVAPSRSTQRDVHALLDRVGIAHKLFERTDRLSGGQQQRVAVARALFQAPAALLADEPVSSVDPARARDTVELLTGVSREDGLTLVMSLHNLELAREYFPRLIGLRAGRVVFDRASDDVPEDAFRALYELTSEELLGNGS